MSPAFTTSKTGRGRKAALRSRALQAVPWLRRHRIWVQGPLKTWEQASSSSRGYADSDHIERVAAATQSVLAGRAAFERDGLPFSDWEPEWPVLLALLRTVAQIQGRIRVLDVGGALGGTYLRAARVAESMVDCWAVVEQRAFVERAESLDLPRPLSFHDSLASGLATDPDLIIFGSVLQYLADPEPSLAQVKDSNAAVIALTRTPFADSDSNAPSVEHVPARFGSMSYPMWVLSRRRMTEWLSSWTTLFDEVALGGTMQTSGGLAFEWRDMVLERLPNLREEA